MAKMDIKTLLKSAGNPLGAIANQGLIADSVEFIDSGSYALNMLLSGEMITGGYAKGRIIGLAGEESSGKSFICQTAARTFLNKYPNGQVFIFDTESVYSVAGLTSMGIDVERTAVLPVGTVEDFRTQCAKILEAVIAEPAKDRPQILIILDSLGMLASIKEAEDMKEGNNTKDMTRTGAIKSAFRVLTNMVCFAGATMLVANHIYTGPVANRYQDPRVISGGSGLKYAASTILMFNKTKIKDEDSKKKIGIGITAKAYKSRFTREESVAYMNVLFDRGLGRYGGLCTMALECGYIKKVGTTFVIPSTGEDLGIGSKDELENNSDELVFRGRMDRLRALEATIQPLFKFGQGEGFTDSEVEGIPAEVETAVEIKPKGKSKKAD